MEGYIQYPSGPEILFAENAVFVRKRKVEEFDVEVQKEAASKNLSHLYEVCDQDGDRLALMAGGKLAFRIARQNDYQPAWMQ